MEPEKALQQIHEEFTECTLCTEMYVEPKMLPCMHTFCLVCLMQHGKGKRTGEGIQCPLCRKEFTMDAGGFNALPTNFYLSRLVELRQMASPKSDALCDECSSEESAEAACIPVAESFCIECTKELCKDCAAKHKSRSHILRKSDGSLSVLQCSKHPKITRNLYCKECSTLICVKCFCSDHNSHKCIDAEEVAACSKQPIMDESEALNVCATKFKEQLSRQESAEQAFNRSRQELENRIAIQARTLKELIDRRSAQLLSETQEISRTALAEMQKRKTLAESSVRGIEELVKYAEKLRHEGSHVDVIDMSELLKTRRQQFEKSLQENKARRLQLMFEASDIDKLITEMHGDMIGKITSTWRTIDEGGDKGCTRCGRTNHIIDDCRVSELTHCFKCNARGHQELACPQRDTASKETETRPSKTDSDDDSSSDYDSSSEVSVQSPKCERCGDSHVTAACGYPVDIRCYDCGTIGHHIRICPN